MKIKLYVYWQQYDFEETGKLEFWHCEIGENTNRLFIREIEVDVPDIELPTHEQMARIKVAALQSEKKAILAECHQKISVIDDKIQQLLSLPNLSEAHQGMI